MKQRIISGLVGIAILLGILTFFNTIYFNIIVLLAYFISLSEIKNIFQDESSVITTIILAIAGTYFMIPIFQKYVNYTVVIAVLVRAYAFITVFEYEKLHFKDLSSHFMFGIYILVGFSSVTILKNVLPYEKYGCDALFLFVFTLVVAWGSDVTAYFSGYLFGKHKMAPKLSPKKTLEGLCGGLIGAVILAMVSVKLYQIVKPILEHTQPREYSISFENLIFIAIISFICAGISVIGDLFASAVKRQSNIKDYGNLIPGHGGILDRFDSVIILTPIIHCAAYFIANVGGIFNV